nr:hypothetical protein 1634Bnrm1_p026 [Cryptomonas sp.]
MYNFPVLCDNLPRRATCQINSFKSKNLKHILSWFLDLSKIKENIKKNFKKKVSIFFSILVPKFNRFEKRYNTSVPYSSKVKRKSIFLIIDDLDSKKKIHRFKKLNIDSIGPIFTKDNFLKSYANFSLNKQNLKECKILLLEKIVYVNNFRFILNLVKNFGLQISCFKVKKNFVRNFTKTITNLWIKFSPGSSSFINLDTQNCIQKSVNNTSQAIAGVYDVIPGGYKNIEKLGIKNYYSCLIYLISKIIK